jgi:hypothetical protein
MLARKLRAGVIVAALASGSASANPPPDIQVKGSVELKLVAAGPGWKLETAAGPYAVSDGVVTDQAGKVVARATRGEGGEVALVDGAGAKIADVHLDAEGYRVKSSAGAVLVRVKIKADKFNLYDGSDKRIGHGKAKDDGFVVRDASDAQVAKIRGVGSLKEASFFAVPLEPVAMAALWSLAK